MGGALKADEEARIAAVKALAILDTAPEAAFDDAVQLAAVICGTPISMVSILDGHRQWFKSRLGLEPSETARDISFCTHAIAQADLFVVEDSHLDARFAGSPLVTDGPKIRFYAGMPLNTPDGYTAGTLCVADTVPRRLTPEQKGALELISRRLETALKTRSQIQKLSRAITESNKIHEQISDTNALFQAFMDNGPLASYIKDSQDRLVYYNRRFAEHFNIEDYEFIGKDAYELLPEELATRLRNLDVTVLQERRLIVTEETTPATGSAGRMQFWRSYKFPFDDSSGLRLLAGVLLEITSEKQAEIALRRSHEDLHRANERLRELTVTDSLTGLANRRGFDQRLHRELKLAERYGTDFTLLLLDVDNFKSFNDTFGHDEGDEVLRNVGHLLLQATRVTDCVCRYGGEEFAVLLPNTGLNLALLIGDRIRHCVASAGWKLRNVTISLGAAEVVPHQSDAATLIHCADIALYEAKALGKNRITAYTSDLESARQLQA